MTRLKGFQYAERPKQETNTAIHFLGKLVIFICIQTKNGGSIIGVCTGLLQLTKLRPQHIKLVTEASSVYSHTRRERFLLNKHTSRATMPCFDTKSDYMTLI